MKDLEFHVGPEGIHTPTKICKSFKDACESAISMAVSTGQEMTIDVVAWTRSAARAWGGDAAVEVHKEDPEASVHERIIIKAESQGRIA
jgi:hypothetical protein